ncbi:hypothetical protein GEMRC1_004375 [Eukaryota sp. GEM-RC1]
MTFNLELLQYNGIAFWQWDTKDRDCCGICHNSFDAPCPKCELPGDNCPLLWGECTHPFHMHCILRWLDEKIECPLCRQEFRIKE